MTHATTAIDFAELLQAARDFETLTGIDIRAWARLGAPSDEYADPDSLVCWRCGLRQKGRHRNWIECVMAYRELVAVKQMRIEQLKETIRQLEERNAVGSGSERSTNRIVVLNGERMCLSDAAREKGISVKALRHRIERRLGRGWEEIIDEIDLAAIGIDKPYARRKGRERMAGA